MMRLLSSLLLPFLLAACSQETDRQLRDCGDCPELVLLEGGSFMRGAESGDPAADESEQPHHEVNIERPFAIAAHHVTVKDFDAFTAATGHETGPGCYAFTDDGWRMDENANWRAPGFLQTPLDPVVCVSWHDATAYAAWMSARTGKTYRLPSEAEWEFAARGGFKEGNFWGDDGTQVCTFANVNDITAKNKTAKAAENCTDGFLYTSPAGHFRPNPFGIHDAIGNAWVWLADCWHGDYRTSPRDGSAHLADNCERRVLRGGSWTDTPGPVRIGARESRPSHGRYSIAGFRLSRDAD
ncbi:formylglycine-generating enzyme family protein [Parvibaculum sp.]|uniref:formylglycine-generating enzyme family protein n=1 Tax=Parvibaculum sp. TaxID=2024848 RepID=UPI003919B5C1